MARSTLPLVAAVGAAALLVMGACSVINGPDEALDPGVPGGAGGGGGAGGSTSSATTTGNAGGAGGASSSSSSQSSSTSASSSTGMPGCGDGSIDEGETCDPPASCPTACDDEDACTVDSLEGSAAECTAACTTSPIVTCDDDGCCPDQCDGTSDIDCAECENGVVELGETCDQDCPATCDDAQACTVDTMTGAPDTCDVVCSYSDILVCQSGDGCCPDGCTGLNDGDCACGNPGGGLLFAENGNGATYCYQPGDSTQTRALKACESHFGIGQCCVIVGGYQDMQYGKCGLGGDAGSIHWHWDAHPVGHCNPVYVVGDVVTPGWCGTVVGNFLD